MIGFLVNVGLLVLAGMTCNKGRQQKNQIEKEESEIEEVVREYSTLLDQFQILQQNEEKEFEKKEKLLKKDFNEKKEEADTVERHLREELEQRRNHLASLNRLDFDAIEKREEELEDERMAVRQKIAMREAKIGELRQALARKWGCSMRYHPREGNMVNLRNRSNSE